MTTLFCLETLTCDSCLTQPCSSVGFTDIMVYFWQHYYGGHNSVGLRNKLIPFLIPFLTHVFVHSATFEFSLRLLLSLLLFFVFYTYSTMARSGQHKLDSLGFKRNKTGQGMSMSGRRRKKAFKAQSNQFFEN